MPVMIDPMLPLASKPLIPYLQAQRQRFRCATLTPEMEPEALEELEFAATGDGGDEGGGSGGGGGGSGSEAGGGGGSERRGDPPAGLGGTPPLATVLWQGGDKAAGGAAPARQAGDHDGSRGRVPAKLEESLRGTRAKILGLLSGRNCVDVEEAELQLRAFGKTGAELVSLYKSKGLHARAVDVLRSAVAGARSLCPDGALAAVAAFPGALDSVPATAMLPRLSFIGALAALVSYVQALPREGGGAELFLAAMRPLAAGAGGAVGMLMALHAAQLVVAGGVPSTVPGAGVLEPEACLALVSDASPAMACPVLWRACGDGVLARMDLDERSLLRAVLAGEERVGADGAAARLPVPPAPRRGWRAVMVAAFLTRLLAVAAGASSSDAAAVGVAVERAEMNAVYTALLRVYLPDDADRVGGDGGGGGGGVASRSGSGGGVTSGGARLRRAVIRDPADGSSSAGGGDGGGSGAGTQRALLALFGMGGGDGTTAASAAPAAPTAAPAPLAPAPAAADRLALIIPFLVKNLGRLDLSQALRVLPADVPLATVAPLVMSAAQAAQDAAATTPGSRRPAAVASLAAPGVPAALPQGPGGVVRAAAWPLCGRRLAVGGVLGPFVLRKVPGDLVHRACHDAVLAAAAAAAAEAQAGGSDGDADGGAAAAGGRGFYDE